jgi:RNA polymerase sigma-70 factor (ECF subfamily)
MRAGVYTSDPLAGLGRISGGMLALAIGTARMAAPHPAWYCAVVPQRAEPSGAEAAELVRAMARGDADALAKLYDLFAPGLLGMVRRILVSAEAAEDVIHDVFLEAWRRAADYDPARGSVRTWLALRARSRALDFRKSAAVARSVSLDEGRLAESMQAVLDDAVAHAEQARVRDALRDLPEDQLRVVVLGYFEGLSSSEIATQLGIPVGTVKSRVAAALARLRATYAEGET